MRLVTVGRFFALSLILVVLLTCYQLVGDRVNAHLRGRKEASIRLRVTPLQSDIPLEQGASIEQSEVDVSVLAPPRKTISIENNRVQIARVDSSGRPFELHRVPLREGENEITALLLGEGEGASSYEAATTIVRSVRKASSYVPRLAAPLVDKPNGTMHLLAFIPPGAPCFSQEAPFEMLRIGLCYGRVGLNQGEQVVRLGDLASWRVKADGATEPDVPAANKAGSTQPEQQGEPFRFERRVLITVSDKGQFDLEAWATVPADSAVADWIQTNRIAHPELLHTLHGLNLNAWFNETPLETEDWQRIAPFQIWNANWRLRTARQPLRSSATVTDNRSTVLRIGGQMPPFGLRIARLPNVPFPQELRVRVPNRALVGELAVGDWHGNDFVISNVRTRNQHQDLVEIRSPAPVAATPQSLQREQAARPRHLVAYLQYLQGGLPDALAALSFAIITAIPFAWLVWRQLPLRPEFARTVVAGSVAFLILHFMIRVGTVLRFPIEELQLREWFGLAYPQWITLGTYYPYLAVGAVLLLTPVYHAQRKAAVASQPLRRGIEAGLLLLTIVVSILFVAISVASANPRGPDSALLAWAENPWILAAVAAAILWFPLRLSVSVLLRVPLGWRAAFVASCGMLLLPIIPHVIEWLSNLAAAAFVQRFNAYPPFIPQQPAATWWRWMVTLLGGFLLFEVVRVAGTMTQLRPIARFFHSRRSALLLPLFMLMAIPAWYAYAQPTEAGRPPDLYDFSQFAHRVDVLLPYLIIPAIVVTIRRLNWQDSFVVPPEVRSLGALLFAFYLCGQAANLFFVPLPMLIGLLLFHFLVRKTLAGPAARLSPEVIRAVLRVRHADALTRERQRVIDKKFQQTDLTSLQYDGLQNENALFVADSQSHLKAKAGVVDVPIFSMGPARGPFRNAMHALRYGLVLSVPLQIATVIRILQQPIGDFPLLDVALAIVRSVSLWGLIAFVFGYFFHLIRGSNGFEKALVFSIAVIIPSVSIRLVQASSVLDQGHMVELIQVTGYLLALSLIAFDVKVLSRASIAWRELPTAYGLTTLTAYVLTLAVSVLSSFVAKEFAPWFYKLVLQAVGVDSK